MPDPEMNLLAAAEAQTPIDPEVRECWGFVVEGIKLGWLNTAKLQKLVGHLQEHEDYAIDELAFDELGERLRVSFLDDSAECQPAAMITELQRLIAASKGSV